MSANETADQTKPRPKKNGPLIALVAAVAVAGVPVGGALAYQQDFDPESAGSAAPLSRGTSPSPTGTPSSTPTAEPSTPPSIPTAAATTKLPSLVPTTRPTTTPPPAQLPGPVESTIDAAELGKGRDPQLPYLQGRLVRGGAAQPATIPGTSEVREIGQVGGAILAAVAKAGDPQLTELLTIQSGRVTSRTPDVTGLVSTSDHRSGAYLVDPEDRNNPASFPKELPGGTIYAVTAEAGTPKRLELTGRWNLELLGYAGGKVYFRSSATDAGSPQLFAWTPGRSTAEPIRTVPNPTAISADGKLAAGLTEAFVENTCSQVYEIATGKRLWRTCDYAIHGFTPDGDTALAGFSSGASGHGDGMVAALDAKTGKVLREWKLTTRDSVAEDDTNILILNDPRPGAGDKNAIVRCSVPTGRCELATAFTAAPKLIGH